MKMFAVSNTAILMFAVSTTAVLIAVAILMLLGCEALKNFIDSEHATLIKKINFCFLSYEVEGNQIIS